MPAIQAIREELLDYDERTPNDEHRYKQWIQTELEGQFLFEFDYDLVTGDAILTNNNPFIEGHLRYGVRFSGDMRFKDFLRQQYGLRRFSMRIGYIDVPKGADEPKLLDQTFRELHTRHQLIQLSLFHRQRRLAAE